MLIFQYIRQLRITVKFIDNKQWTKNFSIDYIYSVKIWLELSSMCASRYSYPKPYFSSVCVYVCLFVNEFCCRFWAKLSVQMILNWTKDYAFFKWWCVHHNTYMSIHFSPTENTQVLPTATVLNVTSLITKEHNCQELAVFHGVISNQVYCTI